MYKALSLLTRYCLIVLSMYLIQGCSKEQADLSALAEEPPRTANKYKFKKTESDIAAGINIPYSVIKSAIKKSLIDFGTVPLNGTVDCSFDKEVKLGPFKKKMRIPCSSSYEGLLHIKQTGNINVSNKNNKLVLIAPVRVYGNVGLRGKTAQSLGLKNKNIDAAVTITVTLDVGLKTDWNAYATVNVKHKWNSAPRIEIIKGKHITFTKQADKFIAVKIKEIPVLVNAQLANLKLKETVTKAWKPYSIPLKQLAISEGINLSIIPKQAVISNIQYKKNSLTMAIGLKIQTGLFLGGHKVKAKLNAPKLSKIKTNTPAFNLFLPVYIDYKIIEKQINKELKGKSFKQTTPVGEINITVNNVFVYPSNKRIAIGIDFNADVDGKHIKTTGKLFLVSKPSLNKSGTALRLTDVAFSRDFDNALLNAITYVFKSKINTQIESKARFDLRKNIKQALSMMQTELSKNQKGSKFKIRLTKPKLRLTQIVVGSNELILESKLNGFVNVQLQ